MNNLNIIFDFKAILSLIVIIGIIGVTLISNFKNKDYRYVFSPSTFVCLILLYYAIIGPFYTIITDDTTYRLTDMSPYYSISWTGVAMFLSSFYLMWNINWVPINNCYYKYTSHAILKSSIIIAAIGLVMYLLWMGPNISVLLHGYNENNEFKNEGTFVMYLMQGIAFFILPSCCLLWLMLKSKKIKVGALLFFFLVILIYLNSGFRFRIVLFLISIATVYYLTKQKRPNLLLWSGIAVLFILFMGVMEYARSYEKGLNLNRIENKSFTDLFEGGTNEARIFMASGAYMHSVQERGDWAYFSPIMNAILMPIPYSIFPQKRAFIGYNQGRSEDIFGVNGAGVAVLEYAEAFIAFGWIGIFLLGAFIGYICKRIWNYYLFSKGELLPLLTLATFNAFLYVYISRGYFAQIFTAFFFYFLIPLILFHHLAKRNSYE